VQDRKQADAKNSADIVGTSSKSILNRMMTKLVYSPVGWVIQDSRPPNVPFFLKLKRENA
jgi:hypothetical protein